MVPSGVETTTLGDWILNFPALAMIGNNKRKVIGRKRILRRDILRTTWLCERVIFGTAKGSSAQTGS